MFTRLSVFPGGCDLAMAQAVCADDDLGAVEVADVIQALVDKSLVNAAAGAPTCATRSCRRWPTTGGRSSPSVARPDRSATRWRRCFARLCAQSAAAYIGAHQGSWLIAIAEEHDNLRAALEWAVANDDAETALTIAGGASWAHWLAGTAVEAKRWLDDGLRLCRPGERRHAGPGTDGAGPDQLPARRGRGRRRRLRSGPRRVPPPGRPGAARLHALVLRRGRRGARRRRGGSAPPTRRAAVLRVVARPSRSSSPPAPTRRRSSRSSTATSPRRSAATGPPPTGSRGSIGR